MVGRCKGVDFSYTHYLSHPELTQRNTHTHTHARTAHTHTRLSYIVYIIYIIIVYIVCINNVMQY